MKNAGFEEFVGHRAVNKTGIVDYCACQNGLFGINCDTSEKDFEKNRKCKHGIFDSRNGLTGCSCRETADGDAIEFHGWYCERENRYNIELSLIMLHL